MLKDFLRLVRILHIFLKARIDSDLKDFNTPIFLSVFFFISPWRLYSSKSARGIRLKKALEESGPIFIKFGQLLSTRPDAIPSDISKILKSLQDNLPPFPTDKAIALIEKEIDGSISEVFSDLMKSQ
jgi:Predicted unusual protein kinase